MFHADRDRNRKLVIMNLNLVVIAGNLTRDPEAKKTPNGIDVTTFSIAINREWKDSDGNLKKNVVYIPVVVWRKQAISCYQYLKKGSPVLIEGRLDVRAYLDKNDNKRYTTEVIADRVQFGSRFQNGDQKEQAESVPVDAASQDEKVVQMNEDGSVPNIFDEDGNVIPF